MQRLFIIAWSAVVIVLIALMVMLYISLIPHFIVIGYAALVALLIVLGCGCWLTVAFTHNKTASWALHRHAIATARTLAEDALASGHSVQFELPDGRKLSTVPPAMHHALPAPKEATHGPSRWDMVLELRKGGKGMHSIAEELKIPYQQVRVFLNQVEGNDLSV